MSLGYLAQGGAHQRLGWIDGGVLEVLLDGRATRGQLMVVRSTLGRDAASPLHVHHREDEMFVLLAGHGLFYLGDEVHELGAGGAIFLPRDVPHAYRFLSDAVDMLTLCTPSGMEDFFRAAGHDLADGATEWEVSMPDLVAAAAAGGQEILGPPPPLPSR